MPTMERRISRRWTVTNGVTVEIVGRNRTLRLANVGAGGFSVASEQMLAAIPRPEFKFTIPSRNWSIVLTAQMAYCLLKPRTNGALQGQYVTGYTFCDATEPDVRDRIRDFLTNVTDGD